ncbi:MAG: hypothetical protein HUK15_01350 [Bacteroidales bacterium]|nr:hypothetical protein [Bacteroidales bacterium]
MVFACAFVASCSDCRKDGYVIFINNVDCMNCQAGNMFKLKTPEFNSQLRANDVCVVFPYMRQQMQEKTIKDYGLEGLKVQFDDEAFEHYKNISGTSFSSIVKLKSGKAVDVVELRNLNVYDFTFRIGN